MERHFKKRQLAVPITNLEMNTVFCSLINLKVNTVFRGRAFKAIQLMDTYLHKITKLPKEQRWSNKLSLISVWIRHSCSKNSQSWRSTPNLKNTVNGLVSVLNTKLLSALPARKTYVQNTTKFTEIVFIAPYTLNTQK